MTDSLERRAQHLVDQNVLCCLSSLVATLAEASGLLTETTRNYSGGRGDVAKERAVIDLTDQASELAAPVPDYEEAATQRGWQWDEGGPHFYRNVPGASAFEPYQYAHFEPVGDERRGDWEALCHEEDIDPYDREVYEHWSVSPWLADKLLEQGEKVDKDFAGMCVWARTSTGQAIYADGVIKAILKAFDQELADDAASFRARVANAALVTLAAPLDTLPINDPSGEVEPSRDGDAESIVAGVLGRFL